jgi:hypothetical protein
MKYFLKYIISFYILICLFSCNDLNNKHITERYYFVAADTKDNTSLGYSINDDNSSFVDVVGETVFSVGYNNRYIIVKQHLTNNKKNTNYYIVPIYIKFNYSPEKGVIGPLSVDEFNTKSKELHIEDIKFTITYDDLK